MGTRLNCFGEAVLTSTHNLCFGLKTTEVSLQMPLYPSFTILKWGVGGHDLFQGHVFLMYDVNLPALSCSSSSKSLLKIMAASDKETTIVRNAKATNDAIAVGVTTASHNCKPKYRGYLLF